MRRYNNALIVVDVQNDFCPGGAMAVEGGDEIIELVNKLQSLGDREATRRWKKVVATMDWHPAGHISFAEAHPGKEPYQEIEVEGLAQNLWPVHCRAGSEGAQFHPSLETVEMDLVVRKGTDPSLDSYSAFFENDGETPTGLHGYLSEFEIKSVYLCGLAFDWCVYFSAVDARRLGYETVVIEDATRAVDVPEGFAQKRRRDLEDRGVRFIGSGDLLL